MKRYVATLKVELQATALEARDQLLKMLAADISRHKPSVSSIGAGGAVVSRATVSRVRPRVRRQSGFIDFTPLVVLSVIGLIAIAAVTLTAVFFLVRWLISLFA